MDVNILTKRSGQIDHKIIYFSMIIIVLGLFLNLSEVEINSALVVYLIILIALGNIGYLYTYTRSQ